MLPAWSRELARLAVELSALLFAITVNLALAWALGKLVPWWVVLPAVVAIGYHVGQSAAELGQAIERELGL